MNRLVFGTKPPEKSVFFKVVWEVFYGRGFWYYVEWDKEAICFVTCHWRWRSRRSTNASRQTKTVDTISLAVPKDAQRKWNHKNHLSFLKALATEGIAFDTCLRAVNFVSLHPSSSCYFSLYVKCHVGTFATGSECDVRIGFAPQDEISFEVDGKPLGVASENVDCAKDFESAYFRLR